MHIMIFIMKHIHFNAGSTVWNGRRPGTGPIHMDSVNCSGFELTLLSCQYDPNIDDCIHNEDALVQCQRKL